MHAHSKLNRLLRVMGGALLICGPAWSAEGEILQISKSVDFGDAESVKVEVELRVGELTLLAVDGTGLNGNFRFSSGHGEPEIDYQVEGRRGVLRITEVDSNGADRSVDLDGVLEDGFNWNFSDHATIWDIRLGVGQPLVVEVNAGAMAGTVDIRGLSLQGFMLETGAGDIDLDLRGEWLDNSEVEIDVGVGELELLLPEDMGLALVLESGIGSVDIEGLEKVEGDQMETDGFRMPFGGLEITSEIGGWFDRHLGQNGVWTNESYGKSAANLRLRIKLGLGQLRVRVKD